MFLFRELGCPAVSLVVPPVRLSLGMDPGLGWDLPRCCPAHTSVKHITDVLPDVEEEAGSDLPVGREDGRGAHPESPGSKFAWVQPSRAPQLLPGLVLDDDP